MRHVAVTLAGGFEAEGRWHRSGVLRELTGAEEVCAVENSSALFPAARITSLLATSLAILGPYRPVPEEAVRSLALGDREALLLHLRRLLFGDRMECAPVCQSRTCGKKLDLDLDLDQLLEAPYGYRQAAHEASFDLPGAPGARVRFRVPNGEDVERAAVLAREESEAAARLILKRCVLGVERGQGWEPPREEDLAAIEDTLPQQFASLDPQAEIQIELTCPECGAAFRSVFDAGDFLFRELEQKSRNVFREVHWMAMHYHWSEPEILSLPASKRQLYLGLLAESLGREAHA